MEVEKADPKLLGQRLADARKVTGKTQEEVADYLGCSRPTFIAMEKGTRSVTPEEVVKLAQLYGRSVHEFVRPGAPNVQLEPHLRAVVDENRQNDEVLRKAIFEFQHLAEDYVSLEKMLNAPLSTNYPLEVRLPVRAGNTELAQYAETAAIRERARLSLGDHPILNLRSLLENEVGIRIFYCDIGSTIAGMYASTAEILYCILVNRKHPAERRRLTLAHEFGHFLCDRYKPGIDYLSESSRKPANERFVESFALSFLMPESCVRRIFIEVKESSGDFQVADLCRLANYFYVSVQAMALRMEALSLIARGAWDLLKQNRFSIAKAKSDLALGAHDTDSSEIYPERYKFLAVRAFLNGLISEGQLARYLRCDRVEARMIVEECSQQVNVDENGLEETLSLPFEKSLL